MQCLCIGSEEGETQRIAVGAVVVIIEDQKALSASSSTQGRQTLVYQCRLASSGTSKSTTFLRLQRPQYATMKRKMGEGFHLLKDGDAWASCRAGVR
jgi:hypothetical protein